MGTGKTEVGRELSNILGWKTLDIDAEIIRKKGMTIPEIFSTEGEQTFRDIETDTIRESSQLRNVIISTGGGAVLRQENVDYLRQNGIIVCLLATPEEIFARTRSTNERPLLQVEDPLSRIRELLEVRRPFYEKADILVDTEKKTPRRIAEEIMEQIKWQS